MAKNNELPEMNLSYIFTEDWYIDLINTIKFASAKFTNTSEESAWLTQYLIEYNINKRLHDKVLPTLVNALPKIFDWRDKQITEAFLEFKDIIDSCDICPTFKNYKARIILNDTEIMLDEVISWKDIVNTYYPEIHIQIIPLKRKNNYTLKLKRIS